MDRRGFLRLRFIALPFVWPISAARRRAGSRTLSHRAARKGGLPYAPVISPDGRMLVLGLGTLPERKPMDSIARSLEARPLAGTELAGSGTAVLVARQSLHRFFSAGKLKRIDVSGGPAQTLCVATFAGARGTETGYHLAQHWQSSETDPPQAAHQRR